MIVADSIALFVVISKPTPVVSWLKDGNQIKPDDRLQVQVTEDGKRHSLNITNLKLEDQGLYSVCIIDEDNLMSSCTLTVKGRRQGPSNLL